MLAVILDLLILAGLLWLLRVLLRGAPYLPSKPAAITEMVRFSGAGRGVHIAELGSGDGRVMIALADAGATVTGYENNPLLVWWSRRRIKAAGLADRAQVRRGDLWKSDLSGYDAIVVFGFTHLMDRLGQKIDREGKPDVVVVSNAFKIPSLRETQRGIQTIVYRKRQE
jgi:protein-L-isoaspartate O-methyltransferase